MRFAELYKSPEGFRSLHLSAEEKKAVTDLFKLEGQDYSVFDVAINREDGVLSRSLIQLLLGHGDAYFESPLSIQDKIRVCRARISFLVEKGRLADPLLSDVQSTVTKAKAFITRYEEVRWWEDETYGTQSLEVYTSLVDNVEAKLLSA